MSIIEICMQAMNAGKHVCCEKPLASEEQMRELCALQRKEAMCSVYSIPPAVQHEYREALV